MSPEEQTKILELRTLLLSFGGSDMVILEEGEPEADEIMTKGKLYGATYRKVRGVPCHCHENVVTQKAKHPEKYRIVTGYALSNDYLWTQHSWLVDKKDRTYETTVPRFAYFGYLVEDE
jgi:hypothetical protein